MKAKRFEPSLKSPCLCGSGLKFKRCCFGNHQGFGVEQQKKARELIEKGEYKEALIQARQSITIYTILHKTNTDPYIRSKNKGIVWILDIDIKALSDLVNTMLDCYRKLGDYEEFSDTLERLRLNINDSRWHRKVTYFQIIARLGDEWNESVGKREVKKLLPLDDETDPEILQLYIHFWFVELPFAKKNDLIEKLISIVESPSQLLQYKTVKAICYLSIGDDEEAILVIEEALKEYESTDWMNDNVYGRHKRADTLGLLGNLKKSHELKNNALQAYTELLGEKNWTETGMAHLYYEIGNCCYHLGKYSEAIDCYKSSLSKNDSELVNIFLAQAYCEEGDEKAVDIIQHINASKLDSSGKLDLIFNYSTIGIKYNNDEMIKNSIPMLKSIRNLEPIFESRRSELLTQITECLVYGINDNRRNTIVKCLKNLSKFVSRYFIVQPNIAGLGINVNSILDDIKNKPNQ